MIKKKVGCCLGRFAPNRTQSRLIVAVIALAISTLLTAHPQRASAAVRCTTKDHYAQMNSTFLRRALYRYHLEVDWCFNFEYITRVRGQDDRATKIDGIWSWDQASSRISGHYEGGYAYRRRYARSYDPVLGKLITYPYLQRYWTNKRAYRVRGQGRFYSSLQLPGPGAALINGSKQPWVIVRATHNGQLILLDKSARG